MQKKYGLIIYTATTANTQANYIVDIIHQILTKMVRTRGLEESEDQ